MSKPEFLELVRATGGHRSQKIMVAIDGMEREILIIDIYALHLAAGRSQAGGGETNRMCRLAGPEGNRVNENCDIYFVCSGDCLQMVVG